MYGDAVVISRSIMDRNNQRCLQNHCSTSFRPNRSIVQHNGKQFIVEFTQRIEQRFIQFMDKKTNRMRFFDVIDCIPSTIVRSYGSKSQSLSQNSTSRPNHRSDQCLARQQIPNYRSQTVIPLSFIDKRSFKSALCELHVPTCSSDDESSTSSSCDSDEETETEYDQSIDRRLRSNEIRSGYREAYPFFFSNHSTTGFLNGAIGEYNLPTSFNPFARSEYPSHNYYYRKQSTLNNCTQPLMIH
ncbi:unnamed protein product [Rotaria sp. Silwood1]|nr:unnamed protein product [Rotaria sp. Silwood1]CAF3355388.1 unnamed protein product [Rotaria sp. Silwood1]CAF3382640.1 unnamed protein product [Rotaria sp. Silwood1]CAF4542451.1 unnamed protein product [Rotaria sp. Silwood1]CAF4796472.1 unnamed protein product [Rotaria sp. Silwood1]